VILQDYPLLMTRERR